MGNDPLAIFLEEASLSAYQPQLVALGVAVPADIADVEDADFAEMGMKGIEIKRIRRKVEEHTAGADLTVPDYEQPSAPPASAPPVVQAMAYEQPQPQQMYQQQPQQMYQQQPQQMYQQQGMQMQQQIMIQQPGMMRPPPPDNCCVNWLVCCFCNPCLVCGICAIIQEGDVQGLYATGNVDMAWVKSQTATQWRNAALVCAVLYWIFVMAPMMF